MLESVHQQVKFHRLMIALVSVSLSSFIILHAVQITDIANLIALSLIFSFFLSIFFVSHPSRQEGSSTKHYVQTITSQQFELQGKFYTQQQLQALKKTPEYKKLWSERGKQLKEKSLSLLGIDEPKS
jgi:hypothetical protein